MAITCSTDLAVWDGLTGNSLDRLQASIGTGVPQTGQKAWTFTLPLSPATCQCVASPVIVISARAGEGQVGAVPGAASPLAVAALAVVLEDGRVLVS